MSFNNRRGIPWSRVPAGVERVLIIRMGDIVSRTSEKNQYGTRLWVTASGRKIGYCGQIYVKPVYKYRQIFS